MLAKVISIPLKIRKQLINFKILAFDYGQYKTIKDWDCVDNNNNKIPWYTYPSIEYFNNIDFSGKSIFEYGSGNSSIYWSNKAKKVTSIEGNKEWYEKVKKSINKNQELLLKNATAEYENSISFLNEKFDVIIIDGIRRVECSQIIEKFLRVDAPEGYMIILDNSDWYKETSKYFRDKLNLIEVDFHGFGPINNYTWTTSVFLSRNFKFQAIKNSQPNFSISAVRNNGE